MPKATVRANARSLPEAKRRSDAAIQKRLRERYSDPSVFERGLEILARMVAENDLAKSLGAEFEAACKEEDAIARDDAKSDAQLDAAVDRSGKLADRILALSGADHLPTIQLKARVYLWAEGETVEILSKKATVTSHKALVSLLRDLGADRPAAQPIEEAAQ
jgi:hypothetical protein